MDKETVTPLARAMGKELTRWRKQRALPRETVAERAGVSVTTLGRWERGDTMPDFNQAWDLADALGVPLSEIVRHLEDVRLWVVDE